jgi:hypothetical protein
MHYLTASVLAALSLSVAAPAAAQSVAPSSASQPVTAVTAKPRTILFVGNSFTQGAHSAVRNYRANVVTDLNGDGYGGVPALFKTFTEEAGLNYAVSLETQGGKPLGFHWAERRDKLGGVWDVVILQDLSTLDRDAPGDASGLRKFAPMFADMFRRANPRVDVELMATWSRADLTYKSGSPWSGKPITAMANDLRAATDSAKAASANINGVLPVGQAWNRAIAAGVADPNPYDGTNFGQVDLWTYDQYHGSIFGYYLEALVVFGRITGVDPITLGSEECAADQLGISPKMAVQLQGIARDELAADRAGRP